MLADVVVNLAEPVLENWTTEPEMFRRDTIRATGSPVFQTFDCLLCLLSAHMRIQALRCMEGWKDRRVEEWQDGRMEVGVYRTEVWNGSSRLPYILSGVAMYYARMARMQEWLKRAPPI